MHVVARIYNKLNTVLQQCAPHYTRLWSSVPSTSEQEMEQPTGRTKLCCSSKFKRKQSGIFRKQNIARNLKSRLRQDSILLCFVSSHANYTFKTKEIFLLKENFPE